MKIAHFETGGRTALGVVVGDGVIDLAKVGCDWPDMLALIADADALAKISAATKGVAPHHALSDVRLLAPLRPGKYMAIGMNYAKHVAEMGHAARPKYQYWFNKQTTCINGPRDPIVTGVTERLDYEVELGVVIGRAAKGVSRADALGHVFGYLVVNDVSARDWQKHSPTFTMGKSFDTHGPIGPWIVTADEIPDPQALDLRCLVNGEVRQESNTDGMLFGVAEQIEYLSTAFTLEPGDLLATGTPEGVGAGMNLPRFLQPGDVVRCEIDGIGAIENRVTV
ncbi:5-carboxymethyl-2-hydroxymuconate isomerase [Altererythrobacter salegens]|uniref:5-carboxymethyl-2-hydroxymuconate isomerase n=1 Tax=Croceibacterium salegens TaxID=1737568 RepID=A0A6I4ST99_9SPHN|nr:fumarylacetoacetate hydrolase family protein [Croceibacterium salegens]MXO58588.1 5-carboxymethyl-2-hydroxymuconate isomerase [Croceibacterium salegens]